jgi:two-component system phosphate regulon sensor histidine kinase PhoR
MSLFMILLSDFTPSIYIFWLALLITSVMIFRVRGLVFGAAAVYAATFITYLVNYAGAPAYLGSGMTAATVTTIVAGAVLFALDYTGDAQQLKEQTRQDSHLSRERLVATINSINTAIIATDKNGYIKVFNAAALALLDTNVNLESKKITRFVRIVDDKGKDYDLWAYAREENTFFTREDLVLKYPDEKDDEINLSVSCSPIAGQYTSFKTGKSESGGFVFLLEDITKRKSLDEERDEFVSVVSHELRTPVAVAEGTISNLQFLLDKKAKLDEMKPQLASAYDQIRYLEQMINDISTLSRAQRGVGMETVSIDVAPLAEEIIGQYQPEALKRKLKLSLKVAPGVGSVKTSKLYLQEILQNFITNALKYTKKGEVVMTVAAAGGSINFAVKDSGIGISKSDQSHIFEKFFRSEDYRTRESSGTGLGLYVTAKLAKMLGTEIKVTSELNHGSEFSFSLPEEKEK